MNMNTHKLRHEILGKLKEYFDQNVGNVEPSIRNELQGLEIEDLIEKLNLSYKEIFPQLEILSVENQLKFNNGWEHRKESSYGREYQFFTITDIGKAAFNN